MSYSLLVCGGREFEFQQAVSEVLDELVKLKGRPSIVIHGGADGADLCGKVWAQSRGLHVAEVRAQWGRLGKAAGSQRNLAMLGLKPDLVVAFPGGSGTKHMVAIAEHQDIGVVRAGWEDA